MFEGEYLNDMKWNGKLYKENQTEYEYGLKNGNGKIKEYDSWGKLIFEGEYLNGKRHGKGKEYNNHEEVYFEGEYLNGKRNGKGKEYDWYNKSVLFEGEYKNGLRWNGKGYDRDKLEFEIKNGNGKGRECSIDMSHEYIGEYKNGLRHGKGEEFKDLRILYSGEYKYGMRHEGC